MIGQVAKLGVTQPDTPHFSDITDRSGVTFKAQAYHTSTKYLLETMGSGVAVFDYDNDGRLDIFLVNGAPIPNPAPKGTIPQKASTLEPPVPPEERRHL
jgi:hypothetical protein